jgi:predicted RNase H-like HicB family nuclease
MAKITFHVDVNEEADGSYWAEVKELPGCFASGFDMDELREAVFEAMQMWLPEGIKLDDPEWKPIKEPPAPRRGGPKGSNAPKKPVGRRQMQVCA